MHGMKRMMCFLILPFLVLALNGCSEKKVTESVLDLLGKTEDALEEMAEKVTIADLEKQADRNFWQETLAGQVSFEKEWHNTYGYNCLSEAEKLWYEEINLLLSRRYDGEIQLSKDGIEAGLTEENLDKIYQCVLMDHPEYFYVIGYEYTRYTSMGKLLGMEICGTYSMELEECIQRKSEIEAVVESLLEQAPEFASDYEKIKYVYETIIYHTEYDLNALDNQNIYSVFVGKASVCQGYAKATQYLLNCLGVECTLVQGEIRGGEGHSWNLVKSAGDYYFVDTTWGDASYSYEGNSLEKDASLEISYDYLCVTTEQLFRTHIPDDGALLPVCEATADNYYIKEGCYFYEYDKEQLRREFAEIAPIDRYGIAIKCATEEVYQEMYEALVENQGIFEFLEEEQNRIAFVVDEKQQSMTFWVTK